MNDDQHLQESAAIQHWLVARIAEHKQIAPELVDIHEVFASYGLSSRTTVSLAGDLATWLGRSLSPNLFYDYPSIERLTRFLVEPHQLDAPVFKQAERQPVDKSEPIALVGIGCRFPGGCSTPEAFWELLASGRNAISEVPSERWEMQRFYDPDPQKPGKMYTRFGGFLKGLELFDAPFFAISPREAMRMDPQQRLLLEVAWEAFEQAGLSREKLSGSKTGVFIGMMGNHEYASMQMRDSSSVNDPYYGLGNASSIASGRISYLLNLHGPCLTIDTACSSSLVALHMACQSLRAGECDLALAGGVHTLLQPELLINFCKMGMLAPDGQCKTFDASADGFVFGEGCGLVVLKRLSDALNDDNPILALIRGSAVNQDGRSNGITAPNLLAQTDVLHQALNAANLRPEQVSYIEAHGSGTALGDPIEIGAVEKVYGSGHTADHRLFVGSVKTNIGHLAGASGIAGVIKTVLALQAKQIPAHLNMQKLNPYLVPAFEHTLALPTTLRPWPEESEPRRAGISAFSWSGTNAHVLLEEAPIPQSSTTSHSWHTIQLSAKSAHALDTTTHNLAAYLRTHQEISMPDLAYTCNVGRSTFAYKRTITCQTLPEAIARLEECAEAEESTKTQTNGQRSVTFLFPGVGEHYIEMARELYEQEPVFRENIERCALLLLSHLKLDIRDIIYPLHSYEPSLAQTEHEHLNFRALIGRTQEAIPPDHATQKLNQTMYAQPALFVVEYALAQLWLSWGVQPHAMIGHSLGEYVVACLAGVLSLEDALLLVAHRAHLIQNLPPGGMLTVMLSPAEIDPFLSTEISLAAINSYQACTLAGSPEALLQVEQRLTEQDIIYRRIPTSHAFHSTMMAPIKRAFAALISMTTLHPPRIPYISNVTGTWITSEQATDPTYWLQHLCQTVRFADGLHEILHQANSVLLEIGPGQSLCSFALQQAVQEKIQGLVALPSLHHAHERRSDQAIIAQTLGQLWLAGIQVKWRDFYAQEQSRMLPLPTYPFERQSYWITPSNAATEPESMPIGKQIDIADWFYIPVWKQTPLVPTNNKPIRVPEHWLLFVDDCGVAVHLAQRLRQQGQEVTLIRTGDIWQKSDPYTYIINSDKPDDYKLLLQDLQHARTLPQRILYLWTLAPPDESALTLASLEEAQHHGLYGLLYLVQALGATQTTRDIDCIVLSNDMQDVSGLEMLKPEKATILGMCKVLAKEYSHLTCRSIDIELPSANSFLSETLLEQLMREFIVPNREDIVAYRGRHRWTQVYEAQPLAQAPSEALPYTQQGVYLITGGLGGLGLALADYLARHWHAKLVLLGRTELPCKEQWAQWLATHDMQDTLSVKIRHLQALEQLGAEVMVISANIADAIQVQQAIHAVHARFGALQGVFHLAALPGEGLIQLKTRAKIEQVLAPKVQGTLVLAEAVRTEPLDFLVLYSSSIIITGGLGEVDYAAANAFVDAFAAYCFRQYAWPCFAIHWGPWQWDAWQADLYAGLTEGQARIKKWREDYGISFTEGLEALGRILASPLKRVAVLTQPIAEMSRQWAMISSPELLAQSQPGQASRTRYARPNLKNPYMAPHHPDEQRIAEIWQDALGIEAIGMNDHFFELGGNSLIGLQVVARLAQEFQVQLNAVSLFECPTIGALLKIIKPDKQTNIQRTEQQSNRGKLRKERIRSIRK